MRSAEMRGFVYSPTTYGMLTRSIRAALFLGVYRGGHPPSG